MTGTKLILVGRHSTIEPLGLLHLVGLAERVGWQVTLILIKGADFQPLYDAVRSSRPDLVGFSVWTGYHRQAFAASDAVRRMGVRVAIGGPHATYFATDCIRHVDWVIRGEGFRYFRILLQEGLPPGIHHDPVRVAEGFPEPARQHVYRDYPEYAACPIKSMMATVGCPFECSYCYAPVYNEMYGGYAGNERPIDQLVTEACRMRDNYPLSMVYFQDDVFGFKLGWLREFAKAWKAEVGVPWHCQIRLELARHDIGLERLELFREAGCTGITLAVESGNDFLRRFVLNRGMSDEVIVSGVERIKRLGFTLRLEQILMVPFSDLETDLQTLKLNEQLGPEMAWTSILAPYGGTAMGTIAGKFGLYGGNNDNLDETFFCRSVLRHVAGGPSSIEDAVRSHVRGERHNPLVEGLAVKSSGRLEADVVVEDPVLRRPLPGAKAVAKLRYLDDSENERYASQGLMLHHIFDWSTKVPRGHALASEFVRRPAEEWTWTALADTTVAHFRRIGRGAELTDWTMRFVRSLGHSTVADLPSGVRHNPYYFVFLPSGPDFARELVEDDVFATDGPRRLLETVGTRTRHWLYDHWLYRVKPSTEPIASRPGPSTDSRPMTEMTLYEQPV